MFQEKKYSGQHILSNPTLVFVESKFKFVLLRSEFKIDDTPFCNQIHCNIYYFEMYLTRDAAGQVGIRMGGHFDIHDIFS